MNAPLAWIMPLEFDLSSMLECSCALLFSLAIFAYNLIMYKLPCVPFSNVRMVNYTCTVATFQCFLFLSLQIVTYFFLQSLLFVSLLCVGHSSGRSLELDAAGISSCTYFTQSCTCSVSIWHAHARNVLILFFKVLSLSLSTRTWNV